MASYVYKVNLPVRLKYIETFMSDRSGGKCMLNSSQSDAASPGDDDVGLQPPTVSHTSLDFGTLKRGKSETLQEEISNSGRKPLLWTASTGETDWLSLDSNAGVLLPGKQQMLSITVHTSSLTVGTHSAILLFTAEADEVSVSTQVIVTLTVK